MAANAQLGNVVLLLHCDDATASKTLADTSYYGLNAACYGTCAPSTVQSKFGGASAKTGASNGTYFAVGGVPEFDFGTADFTVESWVYPVSQGADGGCIVGRWDGTNKDFLIQRNADGSVGVYINGALVFSAAANALPVNAWSHVAVTRSSGTVTLWINGASAGTASFLAAINCTRGLPLYFGQSNQVSTSASWLEAYFDEIRITNGTAQYTAAFTPATGAFDYNNSFTFDPFDTSVGLLMHGDGADLSTVFTDSSNAAHVPTVGGTPKITATSPKFGTGSILFSGSGTDTNDPNWKADYLDISQDSISLGTGDFTVEFWFWPTGLPSASSFGALVDYRPLNTNGPYFGLFVKPDATLMYYVNTVSQIATTAKVTVGSWVHIAAVRKGGTTTLYMNGTASGTWADATNYAASRARIGAAGYGNGLGLQGKIDDIRITSGIARYSANFTPPAAPFYNPRPGPTRKTLKQTCKLAYTKRPISLAAKPPSRAFTVKKMLDYYDGGTGTISGKVTVNSNPDSRKVRLFDARSGRLLRTTWSAADGTYSFKWVDLNRTYFVVGHDYQKTYNAVVQDLITPV